VTLADNICLVLVPQLEEDVNNVNLQKLSVEEENRSVRDSNFELQSKARAAETQAKRMQSDVADKDKQLRIMTDQNSEMLRLLEAEETRGIQLEREVAELRAELDELRQKHGALLATAKTHEELATKAAKEGQLRAEEIRLLRVETEQLKQQNTELKMKTQVEVEALQEQLRVRKEKQYQLLEKLAAQEEAKRQAEDQVAGMEEQLRGLHARNVDLETQIKVESRGRQNLEETNREMQTQNNNLFNNNKELQIKIDKSEKERLRMEAEGRDTSGQMQEVAAKVMQLMERLRLAELGKTKAMEALKKKEQDMVGLQKKNARLIKDTTEESKGRVQAELDNKVLIDQVRAIKKTNTALAQKSKEEASAKVKAMEEVDQLTEKLKAMEARLAFLLNKVQHEEEVRVVQAEDRKKLEAQVVSYADKCEEFQRKINEAGESNRIVTQALRLKQEEFHAMEVKYNHLLKEAHERDNIVNSQGETEDMTGARPGGPDDIDNVRLNEGRGRFYTHAISVGGGSMLQIKSRKPVFRVWLEKKGVNSFLKVAQQTPKFRDMVVEKFSAVYGLLMVEEEEKQQLQETIAEKDAQLEHMSKKVDFVQGKLATEEDAKRRMLLRYLHAVKEHALAVNGGTGGVLQLPESNITDEEVHALSALLRNNLSIDELNLRGNSITDDGARALGAVLAGKSGLRLVDLRGNKIGQGAIRVLAEALERSDRVRHVYVHAGGKALGAGRWAAPRSDMNASNRTAEEVMAEHKSAATVETVCVVDIRDNHPEGTSFPYELERMEVKVPSSGAVTGGGGASSKTALKQSASPTRADSTAAAAASAAGSGKNKTKVSKSLMRSVSNMATSASTPNLDLETKKGKLRVSFVNFSFDSVSFCFGRSVPFWMSAIG
jgi:myosin protein heavy chain